MSFIETFSGEGLSLLILFLIYFALLVWATRRIFRQPALDPLSKMIWFAVCLVVPFIGVGLYAAYKEQYITPRELFNVALAIILFGFLFSFRMWGTDTFDASTGISNWIAMSGVALITWSVHLLSQKLMARHFKANTVFRIWIPGVVIAIILAFLTNGWFIWSAIGCAIIIKKLVFMPGRETKEEFIGPYETSKIIAAGVFASMGLAVVSKLLVPTLGNTASKLMTMNLWLAVFSVTPLFLIRLYPLLKLQSRAFAKWQAKEKVRFKGPVGIQREWLNATPNWITLQAMYKQIGKGAGLSEGELLLFGSRMIWVFTAVFVAATTITILFLNPFLSLTISTLLAIIILLWWHWKRERQTYA